MGKKTFLRLFFFKFMFQSLLRKRLAYIVLVVVPYLVFGGKISSGVYQPKATGGWAGSGRRDNHVNFNSKQGKHLSGGMEGFCLLCYSPCPPAPPCFSKLLSQHSLGMGSLQKKTHNKLLLVITNMVLYFWSSVVVPSYFFTVFARRVKQPLRQWDGFCASLGFFLGLCLQGPQKGKGLYLGD